ncbi:uncharacterized protein LOC141557959 isoform X2 [Sminthopsis crassicaudata]
MVPSPGPRPREHRLWLLGGPPLKTPTLWKQQLLGLAPPMTRPPSIHHHQLPSPENEKRDTISESVGRGAFSTTIYPQGMKRPRHQESQSITGKGEERHFYEKAASKWCCLFSATLLFLRLLSYHPLRLDAAPEPAQPLMPQGSVTALFRARHLSHMPQASQLSSEYKHWFTKGPLRQLRSLPMQRLQLQILFLGT